MATQRENRPVLTNPRLWALVLLTAGGGIILDGLWSGANLFVGGVIGMLVLAVLVGIAGSTGGPEYDRRLNPWED